MNAILIKYRINFFFLFFFIFQSCHSNGQSIYHAEAPIPIDTSYKVGTLSNGIRYIIRDYKVNPGKISFYGLFNIGAIQEEPNEYGMAHFIEHLCYHSSPYFDYFKLLGLSGRGDLNAHTGFESTSYEVLNVPSKNEGALDTALLLLKEAPFKPVFNKEDFDQERKIIREEWRSQIAEYRMSEQTALLVLKGSRYSRPEVLGDTAIMNHFTMEDAKKFYAKWYRPDHYALIIIGDFDASKMEAKIEQVFNTIPKAKDKSPRVTYAIPDSKDPVISIVSDVGAYSSSIKVNYKHNRFIEYNQQQLRKEFIDKLIERMFLKRLDRIINNSNPLFSELHASYSHSYMQSFNYDEYLLKVKYDNGPGRALKVLLTEMERINRYGFTEAELKEAKSWLLNIYKSEKFGNLPIDEIYIKCYYYILKGIVPASKIFLCSFVETLLPELTISEVGNQFKKYTGDVKPVISIYCTKKENTPSVTDIKNILDSVRLQKMGPYINKVDTLTDKKLFSKTLNPGRVTKQTENTDLGSTEWILSNGVHVILKTTSFKKDEIYFGAFQSSDSVILKKEHLVLLKEPYSIKRTGVGNFSATQINQILANKRVEMDYVYSVQKQGIQGIFYSQDFETALQLINMSFSDQSWISKDTIQSLSIRSTGLDYRSSNTFHDSILKYSDNTKFRDLKVMPLERINKVFKNIFNNPQEFTFIFSGDFKAEEAKPLIKKYLGSLTSNTKKVAKPEMPDHQDKLWETNHEWWKTGKRTCEFTYPMNTSRTQVFLRCQGKFNVLPVNSIYCDITQRLLRDRIQALIREKYNATYSVGPGMNIVNPDFAQLSVTFSVAPENAAQMKAVAIEEFQKFMEEGASEVEFNIQKDKVVKQQSRKLSSNEWWANSALFEFYFHHKNIVPTYVEEATNISLKGLKEFTRNIYHQGNIVNIVMKSQ